MAITVLLVEDDERVRGLLRGRLESAGYVVVETSSAEDALIRYHAERPDVVVTDIVLPGKSGLDLIGELQRKFPEARIVAMSGALESDVPGLLRHSKEMGAVYGLPKPFTTAQLLGAIEGALGVGGTAEAPLSVAANRTAPVRAGLALRWGLLLALVGLLGLIFGVAVLRR